MSDTVKNQSLVKIHYVGKFEDGTVFESSYGGDPLEFTVGSGEIIPGIDEGIIGMTVGERRNITVPPEKGYGLHNQRLVVEIPRDQLPLSLNPQVGQVIGAETPAGEQMLVTITEVTPDRITIDANHPLAGKTLQFEVELVAVE